MIVTTPATPDQVRQWMSRAIAQTTDPKTIADLEICREYLTSPTFRHRMQKHVFNATYNKEV